MVKRGLAAVLIVIMVIAPSVALSIDLTNRPPVIRKILPKEIKVSAASQYGPANNLPPNCELAILWLHVPNSYPTVLIEICSPNKKTCGGAYPKQNNKPFEWTPDQSLWNKTGYVKVYTPDKKYLGYSNKFFINGMLPPCQ